MRPNGAVHFRASPTPVDAVEWFATLPLGMRYEAEDLFGALRPRVAFAPHVPDQDFRGEAIPALELSEALRADITATTGGLTECDARGAFRTPAGLVLKQGVLVIKSFLPRLVFDSMRVRLLDLVIEFGIRANQDSVLVEVCGRGYFLATRLLRIANFTSSERNGEGRLKAG